MDPSDFHPKPGGRGGLDRVTFQTPVMFLVLIKMAVSH